MPSADEEMLSGGNTAPVVRVGDTVRRATGRWTPAVHRLLRLCEDADVPGVPRVRGVDGRHREILSFVPGAVLAEADPNVLWSREVLRAAARLLRRIHDAATPLAAAGLTWRLPPRELAEVVCHNDFAPYNLLVQDGELSGAIDFDFAAPGPRLWDVSYLAYRMAPFAEDAQGFDAARFGSADERAGELVAAYGMRWSADEVRAMAAERLQELASYTEGRAAVTGREDFVAHAAMYRRDAARLRG
ncbi:aminoglycoside phosphotransferase family protein [Microbacterium marinilacus]|uniref:Phosphotransferase n=1 Tax=Microbacterium marinilacus TaxID=415209 RepID=A0ABP7B1R7_9MICO|nr:aminoglycoside phosphotransferase family protein [Microbacterium marinilacus]MBY0688762.1 aminoglycoside phosphotransferase family protein [Microbacterium marinilacus]